MKYNSNDRMILEMLEGNDWRYIRTTHAQAMRQLTWE